MSVCEWCNQDMLTADSCTVAVLHRQGQQISMTRYGDERDAPSTQYRCGDCGVRRRGWHHLGCDLQECPLCRRQMMSCGCSFDEDAVDLDEPQGIPFGVDGNGVPTELFMFNGVPVVVHQDEIPASDITEVHGIPCTTALRTVIDIAPEVDRGHLQAIVDDALQRRLFSLDEARHRLAQPDMTTRPGAILLRAVLNLDR